MNDPDCQYWEVFEAMAELIAAQQTPWYQRCWGVLLRVKFETWVATIAALAAVVSAMADLWPR